MHTSYARLFADDGGVSHFEDVSVTMKPDFAVPPAEPLHTTAFLKTGDAA